MERRSVVIGGGPAGLTAGYELTKHFIPTVVLEKSTKVGGIARTEQFEGFRFDMGGHRFYTKSGAVLKMWKEVLGEKFLTRPRLSRIYYRRKFFDYPLKPWNALRGLGLIESFRIVASYLRWQVFPFREEQTFEQWVTNRFGKRLFQIFFESYTEKVWGIPCSELKAEWAAQRIKDLSLRTVVSNMFFRPRTAVRSLIEEFYYPRLGPGMMWERVRDCIRNAEGEVRTDAEVIEIQRVGQRIVEVVIRNTSGETELIRGTDFISSMPITEFVQVLSPPAPAAVIHASRQLKYRDFLTVCLIVNQRHLFPDNWIYIHEPQVKVGRIQNYGNWSADMLGDRSKSSLGLEYFCLEGDDFWNRTDQELIEIAKQELTSIGLVDPQDIESGCVFRVPKSYPIYDSNYREHLQVVRDFVSSLENVQTIGRNGLHRYNNQDHAMLTAMYAVQNQLFGTNFDVWNVNVDEEYLETSMESETKDPLDSNPVDHRLCETLAPDAGDPEDDRLVTSIHP